MSNKINTRIQLKHDIEANWLKAVNFVPMQGEIIIYDIEIDADGNTLTLPEGRATPYAYERMKIGDGKTNVNNLSFIGENIPLTTEEDNGKFLYVENGSPVWVSISIAEEEEF